jgi:hypothetical protein
LPNSPVSPEKGCHRRQSVRDSLNLIERNGIVSAIIEAGRAGGLVTGNLESLAAASGQSTSEWARGALLATVTTATPTTNPNMQAPQAPTGSVRRSWRSCSTDWI